nr:hypothetical protein [Cupriavidus sp. L7L]
MDIRIASFLGGRVDYEFLYFRGDAFQYRLRAERHKAELPTSQPAPATPAPKRTRKPASKGNPNA